jgi:hypothetical protein
LGGVAPRFRSRHPPAYVTCSYAKPVISRVSLAQVVAQFLQKSFQKKGLGTRGSGARKLESALKNWGLTARAASKAQIEKRTLGRQQWHSARESA